MGVAKKGRGNHFQNCSTSSKVLYGCQLVISGEKSFLARSATIIPFGALLSIIVLNDEMRSGMASLAPVLLSLGVGSITLDKKNQSYINGLYFH